MKGGVGDVMIMPGRGFGQRVSVRVSAIGNGMKWVRRDISFLFRRRGGEECLGKFPVEEQVTQGQGADGLLWKFLRTAVPEGEVMGSETCRENGIRGVGVTRCANGQISS